MDLENNEFYSLRNQIESIDNKIFDLFIERIEIVKNLWNLKKKYNLPLVDNERELFLKNKIIAKLKNSNKLSENDISFIYEFIFSFTKKKLEQILNDL